MKKLKLATILGTRPEIIRLSEVIKKCDLYFDHVLIHTGQNWDSKLNDVFFKNFSLKEPKHYLDVAGKDIGESMGNILSRSYKILQKEKPDALLILGDTNSALSAISAKRLKIPIFHMEAGNRCFDDNVPEEINRRIVDHISDINMPYTDHSRRYLLNEGLAGNNIVVTGSPLNEVLSANIEKIDSSNILDELGVESGKFFLLSMHREENIDIEKNFNKLVESINSIAIKYKLPIIYSMHPRSRKVIEKRKIKFNKLVKLSEPFDFFQYNKLQKNAFCVISDSGTLSEESSIMNFPAVLIRTSTERPEALDNGSIILGGVDSEDIINSIDIMTDFFKNKGVNKIHPDYSDKNVSEKVVRIIQSYFKLVNKRVWLK